MSACSTTKLSGTHNNDIKNKAHKIQLKYGTKENQQGYVTSSQRTVTDATSAYIQR